MAKVNSKSKRETIDNPILRQDELSRLSVDELSEKSRKDHQSIVSLMDKRDNYLCLLIIGAICLVVAVLFFILSFKRVRNKPAGIDIASLQFWIFVACTAAGNFLFAYGLVNTLIRLGMRTAYNEEIAAIAKIKDEMADNKK